MTSDFATVRQHLEQAFRHLDGNDEFSERTRAALDVLIEVVTAAEFRRVPAEIVSFESYRAQMDRPCGPDLRRRSGEAEILA
ncbi:hypothetical protein [Nitratireductor soli]|uniref:hypothetical protein n=1 Tax=Nitratireductor soli TaxID=1670619 RepID=UPI000AD760D4|nr:hypothetical protein [Nitratireductor soli]